MPRVTATRGGSAAPVSACSQNRPMCSPEPCYREPARKVNRNPRRRSRNLSPTRRPSEAAPAAFWPRWTDALAVSLLDDFDGKGNPAARWGVES